ncbi:MAG: hypothetical protein NC038_06775 [Paludibacter sp.]|nr:hypothetical protein [Bacteroidales bacterium]MCM1069604.1 hypothetical protein [Prevotella sp.]MCM1354250.1 hypothetical protein [Bacteroides sp.]MCM1443089.1 hypothetical protein [Muribaculum sp.]MCM1482324.1 hypothetical protein [Paludibacter sp.]
MPTIFYSAYQQEWTSSLFWINYLLILLAVFSFYEIGYIHNDTFATRHESAPSLRLYKENLLYFEQHWKSIFISRTVVAVVSMILFFLLNYRTIAAFYTICNILLIVPLFLCYNSIRNHYNVWLYPLLVWSRYVPFLLPYVTDALLFVLLFLSFPCLNMLERFSMPKHRFPIMRYFIPTEQSKTRFRVIYYSLLLTILIPLILLKHYSIVILTPFGILWCYRLCLWLLVQYRTPKNYLQG